MHLTYKRSLRSDRILQIVLPILNSTGALAETLNAKAPSATLDLRVAAAQAGTPCSGGISFGWLSTRSASVDRSQLSGAHKMYITGNADKERSTGAGVCGHAANGTRRS